MGRARWVRLDPIMPATTDEPGLRAAIRAAWDRAASNTSAGDCIELEDLLAASSAASDGSLDVERLARALLHSMEALPSRKTWEGLSFRSQADYIAAEYARLSESPSEGKTE